jgi:hypothetical protein
MTETTLLHLITAVVRAELRAVGLRPPLPEALGVWRWDAEADAWRAVTADSNCVPGERENAAPEGDTGIWVAGP